MASESAFLVDFLPVFRRSLTRTGFQIDHVQYFSDALKPWIARRDRPPDPPGGRDEVDDGQETVVARPFEVIEQW